MKSFASRARARLACGSLSRRSMNTRNASRPRPKTHLLLALVRGLLGVGVVGVAAWLGLRATERLEPKAPGVALASLDQATRLNAVAPETERLTRNADARSPSPCAEPQQVPGAVLPDGRVVLNVAGALDLMALPGVGAKRASAIVALRARLGRFKSLRDLLRVRGLGLRSLRRLEPRLVLDPPESSPPTKQESAAGVRGGQGA